jgi:hypothetical protein
MSVMPLIPDPNGGVIQQVPRAWPALKSTIERALLSGRH